MATRNLRHVTWILIFALAWQGMPLLAQDRRADQGAVPLPSPVQVNLVRGIQGRDACLIQTAISEGADPCLVFGSTCPLAMAASMRDQPLVRWLIGHAPNTCSPDALAQTVRVIVGLGDQSWVEELFACGADPSKGDPAIWGEILSEAGRAGPPELITWLLQHGVPANVRTKSGANALHAHDQFFMCGPPPNWRGPMDAAIAIQPLVEAGTDVNTPDASGRTPLFGAAARGPDAVRLLLSAGARADVADRDGYTPLHMAEDPEVVRLLLAEGADLEARSTKSGETPLLAAAFRMRDPAIPRDQQSIEVVRVLLERGAKADARFDEAYDGGEHDTALTAALYQRQIGTALLLFQHGATYEDTDPAMRNALARVLEQDPVLLIPLLPFLRKRQELPPSARLWLAALENDPSQIRTSFKTDRVVPTSLPPTLMETMAKLDHWEAALELLEQGMPHGLDGAGRTPPIEAWWDGHEAFAIHYLEWVARHDRHFRSASACEAAGYLGRLDLLDHFASNGEDMYKGFANASRAGRVAMVRALLRRGLDPLAGGWNSPLCYATFECQPASLDVILDAFPQSDWKRREYRVVSGACSAEWVNVLRDHGLKMHERDEMGDTPLLALARYGRSTEALEAYLDAGVDISATDRDGNTALHLMFPADQRYGFGDPLHGIQLLLAAGADVNARDACDRTSIMLAAGGYLGLDSEESLGLLLQAGADPRATDRDGNTALHCAVRMRRLDVAQLLLLSAPDLVNSPNHQGETALHLAAAYIDDLVPFLLEHGARLDAPDRHGETPFLRCARTRPAVAAVYLKYRPDLTARDRFGRDLEQMLAEEAGRWEASQKGKLRSSRGTPENPYLELRRVLAERIRTIAPLPSLVDQFPACPNPPAASRQR